MLNHENSIFGLTVKRFHLLPPCPGRSGRQVEINEMRCSVGGMRMTATPEIIPTDLTLEIGDNLSPERFMTAARAFFGYMQDISDAIAPEGSNIAQWIVRVREGSSLLAVDPTPNVPNEVAQLVYNRAEGVSAD